MVKADTNAQIYDDYRPRYPQRLISDLRQRTIGDRAGLLIDWGCGTGEITLPLSQYFDRAIAVDTSVERISLARGKAQREAVENIEWHVSKAENIDLPYGDCDLIVSASAFHWMDRSLLSSRAFEVTKPKGAFAVVGGAGTDIWQGGEEWHRVAVDCLGKYLPRTASPELENIGGGSSATGAVGPSSQPSGENVLQRKRWHAEFLEDAGFNVDTFKYPTTFSWPVDQVAGYMYSITGGLPWELGGSRAAFEADFSDALGLVCPSGLVEETIEFFLLIGHK